MNSLIASLQAEYLQWFPELGLGWYPVTEQPYDRAYWEKYRAMDETPVGAALTDARIQLVSAYHGGGDIVDIGIGGGRFCAKSGALGFDINPDAIAWLNENGTWFNPYESSIESMTFWDSLEHIHNPGPLLSNIERHAFISCPIFDGPEHVLRSRHYRKDEHCWYFTAKGLEGFMAGFGFALVEKNAMESQWREDIQSFVFERTEL